jgi:hypothetical protein
MRFGVIAFALALTAVAVSPSVHAQALNPAQVAGIAQGVVGLIFGVMNPTPQCGPHDVLPQPYRPSIPVYRQPQPSQPRPYQQRNLSDDDDDDGIQPLQRRPVPPPGTYSSQPQTRPYQDEDDSDQPAEVRAPQTSQPRARVAAQRQAAPDYEAQDRESTDSGQVAEIPAQPVAGTYGHRSGQSAAPPPTSNYDFATDR